jgi:serine/threonine protein kinase
MLNKSLDKWLSHDKLLNWNKQMSIIIGVIQGLAYLHHKCNLAIVHIDIKPGNILWIRITPQNWLILGWQIFLMALVKIWYVPCHFFSFINYVHAHYIYTNIELGFETFVIENRFTNKLKKIIGIAILLMWIL